MKFSVPDFLCKTPAFNPISKNTTLPEAISPCFAFSLCPLFSSSFSICCYLFLLIYSKVAPKRPKLDSQKLLFVRFSLHIISVFLAIIKTSFISKLTDLSGHVLPEYSLSNILTDVFVVFNLLSYFHCWQNGIPSSMFLHLSWFIGLFTLIPMEIFLFYNDFVSILI